MDDTKDNVTSSTLAAAGGDPAALEGAVQTSIGKPAPADPKDAALLSHDDRLTRLEAVLGVTTPLAGVAESLIAAAVPAAGPVLARLPALEADVEAIMSAIDNDRAKNNTAPGGRLAAVEHTLTGVLQALTAHFGALRIADMPTAIAAPPAPAAPAAKSE